MIVYQSLLRLMLATFFAIGLIMHLQWSEDYWILLTALFALQWCPSVLWWQELIVFFTVTMVTLVLLWLVCMVPQAIIVLAWSLFVITIVLVYLGLQHARWAGAFFLVNVLVVLAMGLPVSQAGLEQRGLAIVMGLAIALMLRLLVFPARSHTAMRQSLVRVLHALAQFNRTLFLCFLSQDYPQRTYYYEKQLHNKRTAYLYAISTVKYNKTRLSDPLFDAMVSQIDHLYEIILSLSCLLSRVGDHTTFQMVTAELTGLSTGIERHLHAMSGLLKVPSRLTLLDDALNAAIFQLEEVHRSALQVVAREPMVFLFFQHDLNALNEALGRLDELLQQWMNQS